VHDLFAQHVILEEFANEANDTQHAPSLIRENLVLLHEFELHLTLISEEAFERTSLGLAFDVVGRRRIGLGKMAIIIQAGDGIRNPSAEVGIQGSKVRLAGGLIEDDHHHLLDQGKRIVLKHELQQLVAKRLEAIRRQLV